MWHLRSCVTLKVIYDDFIMRTIIDLPDEQVDALKDMCKVQRISRAEAIRRALAEMLAQQKAKTREMVFGSWRKKGDSRKFVESLREEWDK